MQNAEKYLVEYNPVDAYTCFKEGCEIEVNSIQLHKHYQVSHSKDKLFRSPCLFSKKCFHKLPFKSFKALDTHLRKFHKSFFSIPVAKSCETSAKNFVTTTVVAANETFTLSSASASMFDNYLFLFLTSCL